MRFRLPRLDRCDPGWLPASVAPASDGFTPDSGSLTFSDPSRRASKGRSRRSSFVQCWRECISLSSNRQILFPVGTISLQLPTFEMARIFRVETGLSGKPPVALPRRQSKPASGIHPVPCAMRSWYYSPMLWQFPLDQARGYVRRRHETENEPPDRGGDGRVRPRPIRAGLLISFSHWGIG